jgi:hypothetical protein
MLNPKGAATSQDANSIFVFAITIAMITATSSNEIKPVEVYLMLLICSGYFFTVLSFLGLRMHFSSPKRLARFIQRMIPSPNFLESRRKDWKTFLENLTQTSKESAPMKTYIALFLDIVKLVTMKVSFRTAAYVRYPAVSWSGVAWRSFIASFLFGYSIWFWFSNWLAITRNRSSCSPTLYLFGRRSLNDMNINFFRASTIILAVPILFLLLIFAVILIALLQFTRDFVFRHGVISVMEAVKAGSWDRLPEKSKQGVGLILAILPNFIVPFDSPHFLDVLLEPYSESKFWTLKKENIPPFSDLTRAHLSFWSRGIETETAKIASASSEPGYAQLSRDKTCLTRSLNNSPAVKCVCIFFHALTLATIGCFIAFTELTIKDNRISGVYTIKTTGQLIPFIIGLTSFIGALRDLLLRYLQRASSFNLL